MVGRLRQAGVAWFVIATTGYALHTVWTILRWAPHWLYADQWRQYLNYLSLPFPQNVFAPDNSHRLVLPNLIAWLEINWLHGNQWLQIAIGITCIVGATLLAARLCLKTNDLSPLRRWAAVFLCALAMLWLGNVRTLTHSTELMHTSLPIFFVMLSITCAERSVQASASKAWLALALLAGLAATFSFGYGLAVFVGFIVALQSSGNSRSHVALGIAGLVGAALLYFLLPGGDSVSGMVMIRPLENLRIAAAWLSSPIMYAGMFLWDPQAVGLLPTALWGPALAVAQPVSRTFPDLTISVFPQCVMGAVGMAMLVYASVQHLRRGGRANAMQTLGFGVAWFGFAAAGIVSLSRLQYLYDFPAQVYADRYMPWPCLFWLGLALVALGGQRPYVVRATLALALALPLLAMPTQQWGVTYATIVAGHTANVNAGVAVGVVDRGADFGQSQPEEIIRAMPELRRHAVEPFQRPELDLLGTAPDAVRTVSPTTIEVRSADNLLGTPATAVLVHVEKTGGLPQWLLLAQADGTVVGIVARDRRSNRHTFSGYARGVVVAQALHVVVAPRP